MTTCEKCGQRLTSGSYQHKAACDKMPPPHEVADMVQAGASYLKIATTYGVSDQTVRKWVRLSGRTGLGRKYKTRAPRRKAAPQRTCHRCGLVLTHADVPDAGNGLCAWCALQHEEPNATWVMAGVA